MNEPKKVTIVVDYDVSYYVSVADLVKIVEEQNLDPDETWFEIEEARDYDGRSVVCYAERLETPDEVKARLVKEAETESEQTRVRLEMLEKLAAQCGKKIVDA